MVNPPDNAEGDGDEARDPIDEIVDESFPASDPPATWAGEDEDGVPPPPSTVIRKESHGHQHGDPGTK
jgi:hypothetical protein